MVAMASREYVTLAAGVVSTVTLDGAKGRKLGVCILAAPGAPVYFTIGFAPPDPVAAANDTFALPNAIGAWRIVELDNVTTDPVVKILTATGTPIMAVEIIDDEFPLYR
jgi:hypothetical protein